MPDFLLEIGTEEIPDWMIERRWPICERGFRKQRGERRWAERCSLHGCDAAAPGVACEGSD